MEQLQAQPIGSAKESKKMSIPSSAVRIEDLVKLGRGIRIS